MLELRDQGGLGMLTGILKGAVGFLFGEDEATLILELKKIKVRVQMLVFDALINLIQLLRKLIHFHIDLAVLGEYLFLEFLSGKKALWVLLLKGIKKLFGLVMITIVVRSDGQTGGKNLFLVQSPFW